MQMQSYKEVRCLLLIYKYYDVLSWRQMGMRGPPPSVQPLMDQDIIMVTDDDVQEDDRRERRKNSRRRSRSR